MASRSAVLCGMTLLVLTILVAGTVPTAAIRPGSESLFTGTRQLLEIGALPTGEGGGINTVHSLIDTDSSSSTPTKAKKSSAWTGSGLISGVVMTQGGTNNNGQLKKRVHATPTSVRR